MRNQTQPGDSCVAVLGCVLRAAGRQAIGALFNLGGYWAFGLPCALSLAFRGPRLETLGLWYGLASAAALQAVVFLVLVLRFDWREEVARARRLNALMVAGATSSGVPPPEGESLLGGAATGQLPPSAGAAGVGGGKEGVDEDEERGLLSSPTAHMMDSAAASGSGSGDLKQPLLQQQ